MEQENVNVKADKVGFVESESGRKSMSRLAIAISAGTCVFAALVEGVSKVASIFTDSDVATADWNGVTFMIGSLLVGTGAVKAAQGIKALQTNKTK